MPEMHLRQPGFSYSACGSFTKNKERIQNLKKREVLEIFIKMDNISLLQHDMVNEDFKDLPTTMFIRFWDILIDEKIFFSP